MRIGQMSQRECRHQPHPIGSAVGRRRCTIISSYPVKSCNVLASPQR
jgi:hypothetical protein